MKVEAERASDAESSEEVVRRHLRTAGIVSETGDDMGEENIATDGNALVSGATVRRMVQVLTDDSNVGFGNVNSGTEQTEQEKTEGDRFFEHPFLADFALKRATQRQNRARRRAVLQLRRRQRRRSLAVGDADFSNAPEFAKFFVVAESGCFKKLTFAVVIFQL